MAALGNMLDTAVSALDPVTVMMSALSKPTLLVDIDDTIAYWTYAMAQRMMVNTQDPPLTSASQNNLGDEWDTLLIGDKVTIISAMVADPQAVFGLRTLREIGFPIVIWSDRGLLLQDYTAAWARVWGLTYDRLQTGDYGWKRTQFDQFGPSNPAILIDDKEDLCAAFKGPGRNAILRRWPWTNTNACPDVRAVDSWVEIVRALPGVVAPDLELQEAT